MNWYLDVLKNKYVAFDGRARRTEFWMFVLFNMIVTVVLGVVGGILHLRVLSSLYSIGVFIPSVGVAMRRMHDTGRPGWWILIGFIPVVGWLAAIYLLAQEGQPGSNAYGPDPKESPVPV